MFPDIFGEARQLSPPGGIVKFNFDDPDEVSLVKLPLHIPKQKKTLWCWAAVGSGIASFYDVAVPSQCRVAADVLGREHTDCCDQGGEGCNQFGYLNRTLAHFNCFDRYESGASSATAIKSEVEGRRPLGVRVQWTRGRGKGSGHFVAVSGVRVTDDPMIVVKDPWEGTTEVMALDNLERGYGSGKGKWTHSFFTLHPDAAALAGGSPSDSSEAWDDIPELLGG